MSEEERATGGLGGLQAEVARFAADHGLELPVPDRVLDLASEVGELAKEVLRATAYGRRGFVPSPAFADELGDVACALVCLAEAAGVDLGRALEAALAKYRRRLEVAGGVGSEGGEDRP